MFCFQQYNHPPPQTCSRHASCPTLPSYVLNPLKSLIHFPLTLWRWLFLQAVLNLMLSLILVSFLFLRVESAQVDRAKITQFLQTFAFSEIAKWYYQVPPMTHPPTPGKQMNEWMNEWLHEWTIPFSQKKHPPTWNCTELLEGLALAQLTVVSVFSFLF